MPSIRSGLKNLLVLTTSGSGFGGDSQDPSTVLRETQARSLATRVTLRWRHASRHGDWGDSVQSARSVLLDGFAGIRSAPPQQSLFPIVRVAIEARAKIAEVRMSMPNRHQFVVDEAPIGPTNDDEIVPADRPNGLIEASV